MNMDKNNIFGLCFGAILFCINSSMYSMNNEYEFTSVQTKFFVQDLVTFDHTYFPGMTKTYMKEHNISKIEYDIMSGSFDFENIRVNDDGETIALGKIYFRGKLIRTIYHKNGYEDLEGKTFFF